MTAMKRISLLAALAGLGPLAAGAVEPAGPVIPDARYVYCTTCHGVNMGGNVVIAAPRLSGMDRWYVERQLHAFKKGWRGVHPEDDGGHEMRPMAAVLTDAEIAEVSGYVHAVDSAPPAVTVEGDAGRGEALYASCAACHGADAAGNEALASPPLTGLNDWYLLEQLEKFKVGVRGNHPEDSYGQQMRAAAGLLADRQAMADVVRYITTLNPKRERSRNQE